MRGASFDCGPYTSRASAQDACDGREYSIDSPDQLFLTQADLCYDGQRYPMTDQQPQKQPGVSHHFIVRNGD